MELWIAVEAGAQTAQAAAPAPLFDLTHTANNIQTHTPPKRPARPYSSTAAWHPSRHPWKNPPDSAAIAQKQDLPSCAPKHHEAAWATMPAKSSHPVAAKDAEARHKIRFPDVLLCIDRFGQHSANRAKTPHKCARKGNGRRLPAAPMC